MKYLIAIHRPENFDFAAAEAKGMVKDIDAVNDEMVDAGVRIFVGGLKGTNEAKSLYVQTDGTVIATDGPYLKTKDYVNGFWVLETSSLDEALEWGRKAAIACQGDIEVRPFH